MSFDIVLQRFEAGEAADADGPAVMAVLEPLIAERAGGWARIVTGDGEADVYGVDHPRSSLMVNHASGRAIWDVLYELARARGMVVMPVGCPTCVVDPALAEALPDGLPPAVVVTSGAGILAAAEGTAPARP